MKKIILCGIPSDENSSFMHGSALAPKRIRENLHAGSTNFFAESGIDILSGKYLCDFGDLRFGKNIKPFVHIEKTISSFLKQDDYVLSLGGDHAITYPIVKAFSKKYEYLNILHLDAHPDLYNEYDGNKYSNACPFARIMEEKLAANLIQVGIRTMNSHQRSQAEKFGVEVFEMKNWDPGLKINFEGPIYISLDIDVMDPAFAPGVSHHEPGGMSARNVIQIIQNINVPVVGADIVEYNPKRDPLGVTAMVAVKLLKEIAGKMIETNNL